MIEHFGLPDTALAKTIRNVRRDLPRSGIEELHAHILASGSLADQLLGARLIEVFGLLATVGCVLESEQPAIFARHDRGILERAGLADRRESATDRRVKLIGLTAKGARIKEDLMAEYRIAPPELLQLGEADLRTLIEVFKKIR